MWYCDCLKQESSWQSMWVLWHLWRLCDTIELWMLSHLMFRFMSLGGDHTALEEISKLFINLFTVSLIWCQTHTCKVYLFTNTSSYQWLPSRDGHETWKFETVLGHHVNILRWDWDETFVALETWSRHPSRPKPFSDRSSKNYYSRSLAVSMLWFCYYH